LTSKASIGPRTKNKKSRASKPLIKYPTTKI
jgi:hypothetical protein